MERIFLRSLLVTVPLFCLDFFCPAQDLTGIWKGYFVTDAGEHYKLEFQIKQNKTLSVTGVSYSYLDVRFYGKATMTGSFNKQEKKFQIQELRTVEVKNMEGGGTCLMKYIFTFDTSGKEQFLEGTFIGRGEDRKNPKNDGEWGDCGGGKVYLRRVENSDFYVEPFLRDNPKHDEVTTRSKTDEPVPKTNPSQNKSAANTTHPVKKTSPPVVKKTNPPVKNNGLTRTRPIIVKPNAEIDTTQKTEAPVINEHISEKKSFTPEVLKTRENALVQTITVNTETVKIRLYDNGEIDGDSISVFVDKKLVLSHQELGTKPITITLKFGVDENEHEVIMVAENLGRIPPNTALMIVDAGDKRYEVQIASTEQKNALVRFRFESPSN